MFEAASPLLGRLRELVKSGLSTATPSEYVCPGPMIRACLNGGASQ